MNADYLAAKPEGVHALARDGSPAAEEERAALIGAMAGLGLPEGHYLRDPSRLGAPSTPTAARAGATTSAAPPGGWRGRRRPAWGPPTFRA